MFDGKQRVRASLRAASECTVLTMVAVGAFNSQFAVVSLSAEAATDKRYDNHVIANVNDHVIRISVMTEAFHWHFHPDSDESFLVLEGGLIIDLEDRTIELRAGHVFTVEQGVRHRTSPVGARSVNLTFERKDARTETVK